MTDEDSANSRRRIAEFCAAVRTTRRWTQRDVSGHLSPLTGEPYIPRRSYQNVEDPDQPGELRSGTLRGAELGLEIPLGTLDAVAASEAHGIDPASLPYARIELDRAGRLVQTFASSPTGTPLVGRIADAASRRTG